MKKVNVLLSAFNGEKFIQEQIESIIGQEGVEIALYIRDDGSRDSTREILKKYQDKAVVIFGENKGFVRSFFDLLLRCDRADYYAFADQDDVWFKDKINRAVVELEKIDTNTIPLVYCSNYLVCDEKLNIQKQCPDLFEPFSIEKTVVNGQTGFGLTQVFNNKMRDIVVSHPIPHLGRVFGHDTWVHFIGLCFGKVIYDKNPTVFYRRHGMNTSSQEYRGGSKFVHRLWQIKEFLLRSNGKLVYLDVKEFREIFDKELSIEQKNKIDLYITNHNFRATLKKVICSMRYRPNIVDEIMLRMLFLIHKM